MGDLVEDRVISEEYKVWKRNVPFLYDCMTTRAVEYPSPTVEWLPEVEPITVNSPTDPTITTEATLHRLLLGTNVNGHAETNYLTVASIILPEYTDKEQNDLYHMKVDEFGAFSVFPDKYLYDFKIPHDGIVQIARHMPGNSNLIATTNHEDLFIFDITECRQINEETFADEEKVCDPIYQFKGLNSKSEIVWHPEKQGVLLTGFKQNQVALFDINNTNGKKNSSTTRSLKVSTKYSGHEGEVTNVAWHSLHTSIFGSVSSSGQLALWDIRSSDTSQPSHMVEAHKYSATCVEFNPFSQFLLATSSADRSIALWDLRNLKLKLHSLRVREDLFHRIRWSPHYSSVLGACTNDRRVYLFDMDRLFEEQTPDDADDGPSSLLFSHNGHTSPIYDLAWNPNDELVICSVSEDNIVQVWQVMSKFLSHSK